MLKPADRINLLGVEISNVSMAETLLHIETRVASREFCYIVTPNVDHLMKLQNDREFRKVYEGACLAVPDGVPLLWAARVLGTPLKERVNGTDLFIKTCERSAAKGHSIFLLGGNPGSAEKAGSSLERSFPGLRVAGHYCPEYGFDRNPSECERIQKLISASKTDILFVGLGAPKQEKWIATYGPGCDVRVAIGIGVSFSFIAGDIKRAPAWMQRNGLEWLWRLLSEPRRLSKRYLLDDMPFVWHVGRYWLKGKIDATLQRKFASSAESVGRGR